MDAITPPSGCMSSIEKCIEALCAEKSEGTGMIKWFNRMSELTTLGQLDENLSGDVVRGSCYETEGPVRGSIQYGKTQWASDRRFTEAANHKYATPEQKASLRQEIARNYLDDHPDDCRPPQFISQKAPQSVPQQLSLFDFAPKAAPRRALLPDVELQPSWWEVGAWTVLATAVIVADRAVSVVNAVGNVLAGGFVAAESTVLFFATIGLRYQMDFFEHREQDIL